MLTFALATAADIRAFYGSTRETLRAVCVKRDGEPVALIGLAHERFQSRFFSEHKDMTCAEMVKSWRAVRFAMRFVKESRRPVVAVAEGPHGHKNLTRLGFTHIEGDYYLWRS